MKSIPYCYIRRNFDLKVTTPKSDWIKIIPNRFVYHLKYINSLQKKDDIFLKRLSFVKEGICGIDKGLAGVWANNQMTKVEDLFPICFDHYGLDEFEYLSFIERFDLWCIDTSISENEWYVDPNLIRDKGARTGKETDYVYTENTIHPGALKLFNIRVNDYRFLYKKVVKINFSLVPVNEINEIIEFKWGKRKLFGEDDEKILMRA